MNITIYELIGYLGSALVLISFMMTSVVRLRLFNMAGSLVTMIYGFMIHAYPTVVLNGALLVINVIHLLRVANHSDIYSLVPTNTEDPMYKYFLEYHGKDILKFFPDFDPNVEADEVYFICCNSVLASLLICRRVSEYTVEILLDYSIPEYRDYSIGQYQFRQLTHKGYHKAVFHGEYEKHTKYLTKMEFVKEGDDYVKMW